jgi:signal transduction histidine kinase
MAVREKVILDWMSRVRRSISAAVSEDDPIIVNTLPAFIENLAQTLDQSYPRELATEGTTIAAEHGGERARITRYLPVEVIKEYQILRDVILQILSEDGPLRQSEIDIIIKSVDHAMSESLTAYFLVHQSFREQFTMILTHDLRSPLTAIKATTDLLFRHPRIEQVPHLAARIADNVRRIDRMTQDLLDVSRIQFGEKIHFEVIECDLYSLLRETLSQLASIHGERFVLEGKPVQGYWNCDAFRRAIENLVVNAIKYGDSMKPIIVTLQETHGRVIVSVRNEGPHIPVEEQEGIFQSFMRTQSAQNGKKGGWGLGLAMVRGMAEGHGGSVALDSAPGRGTTFIIDVPVDSRPHLAHPLTPGT